MALAWSAVSVFGLILGEDGLHLRLLRAGEGRHFPGSIWAAFVARVTVAWGRTLPIARRVAVLRDKEAGRSDEGRAQRSRWCS